MPFRFLNHTGDTQVEVSGRDARELFREAARALTAVYVDTDEGAPVEARDEKTVRLGAGDGESLLVQFLNELIYLFDTERFLSADVAVDALRLAGPAELQARLLGETFDADRHVSLTEVKAATYHGVAIRETRDGLRTEIVFDL